MKRFLKISAIAFGLLTVLTWSNHALASPYGEGSYGDCQYSRDCPQPANSGGGSSSGTGATTTTPNGDILLNDFSEYFASVGKDLTLAPGQVIYVDVTKDGVKERHTVTIKEVGADYVIVVIASDPIEVRFDLGDTKRFDLTSDGKDDIQIKLLSISGGKASFNFIALSDEVKPTPSATKTPADSETSDNTLWIIGISALALLAAFIIFFLLWKRRKDRKEQKSITTNKK